MYVDLEVFLELKKDHCPTSLKSNDALNFVLIGHTEVEICGKKKSDQILINLSIKLPSFEC